MAKIKCTKNIIIICYYLSAYVYQIWVKNIVLTVSLVSLPNISYVMIFLGMGLASNAGDMRCNTLLISLYCHLELHIP